MVGLIAAVVYSVCTNCVGVGSVEYACPDCDGKGWNLSSRRTGSHSMLVPCPKCTRGLVKPGAKGSGKVKRTCPVCKGQKKTKALAE